MQPIRENRLLRILREGGVAVGATMHAFPTRESPGILDYAGLDWVMIDMEHTGWSIDTVADLITWFKTTTITTIVRPPDNLHHLLSPVMDAGACGVQCAKIESAEDARAIVDAVMYAPLGDRGIGFPMPGNDFHRPKAAEYPALMQALNEQVAVVAMIESVKGLEAVEEIAAVEGIGIIQPSSNDLSNSLGIPGQYQHPKYKEALRRVADACKKHGKAAKINPHGDDGIDEAYTMGYRVLGGRTNILALQDVMKGDMDKLRERTSKLKGK